jgi:membrane protease YdiL (CAAX protease family)
VLLRDVLGVFGLAPDQAYLAMILIVILAIPLVRTSRVWLVPRYFAYMLGEALAYSLALGFVINLLLQPLIFAIARDGGAQAVVLALPGQTGTTQIVAQSLGAGLFEEFLFRVLILNALLLLTRMVLAEWLAVTVAILGAAFVFALAHYVGPLGDPLDIHSFLFRWMAGLLFTVLYYSRGFAVTAYAHALYDIRVLMFL